MYISNEKFVKKYFVVKENVDEILDIFYILEKILDKFKNYSKSKIFFDIVADVDKDLYELMMLLQGLNKLNVADIKLIISLIKKYNPDYKKKFVAKGNENILIEIEQLLRQKFGNVQIDKKVVGIDGAIVSGEGYYFKKYLEKDIDKILKI